MLTSLWRHMWEYVWGEKHEGGTDHHRAEVANVDVPMDACVGIRLG